MEAAQCVNGLKSSGPKAASVKASDQGGSYQGMIRGGKLVEERQDPFVHKYSQGRHTALRQDLGVRVLALGSMSSLHPSTQTEASHVLRLKAFKLALSKRLQHCNVL
eukprot:2950500-Amphidinium_carterae.2